MSLLSLLFGDKKKTASVAKERLQIILAHERSGRSNQPDYLPDLQRDLVAVLSKYVKINPQDIKVNLERQDNLEVLEVRSSCPTPADLRWRRHCRRRHTARVTLPNCSDMSRSIWSSASNEGVRCDCICWYKDSTSMLKGTAGSSQREGKLAATASSSAWAC